MLATTLQAVKSIMETDASLDTDERMRILKIIRHGAKDQVKPQLKLLRRRQVADRLSVSLRTIDNLAKSGTLRRIKFPGRQRGGGFLETDVERLMVG